MGSPGREKATQKRLKFSVHQPCLPLLSTEAMWRAQSKASPLGLTVRRTSQGLILGKRFQ